MDECSYEITSDHGHYNVYINGEFYSSADSFTEAANEIEEYMKFAKENQE